MTVPDTFFLRVPRDAAPGRYIIKFALRPETFLPNVHWVDVLRDEEADDGPVVGSITVATAP